MEISNQIKAKVFAQYYGQEIARYLSNKIFDSVDFAIFSICKGEEGWLLVLKPLSDITDEDAIECSKIEGLTNAKVSQRGKGGINLKDDSNSDCPYDLLLVFDTTEICLYQDGRRTFPKNQLLIYQHLISKGYDLPHYLLGGKTLQESGLAIYEK